MTQSKQAARHILKLYVTGNTTRSRRAIATLRRICAEALGGSCDLQIIDVLEQPHLAEEDRVLVTPTLIRQLPPPVRRLLGDLSDLDRVLAELRISMEDTSGHASAPAQEDSV